MIHSGSSVHTGHSQRIYCIYHALFFSPLVDGKNKRSPSVMKGFFVFKICLFYAQTRPSSLVRIRRRTICVCDLCIFVGYQRDGCCQLLYRDIIMSCSTSQVRFVIRYALNDLLSGLTVFFLCMKEKHRSGLEKAEKQEAVLIFYAFSTRSVYSPLSVFTRMMSPSLINIGT